MSEWGWTGFFENRRQGGEKGVKEEGRGRREKGERKKKEKGDGEGQKGERRGRREKERGRWETGEHPPFHPPYRE